MFKLLKDLEKELKGITVADIKDSKLPKIQDGEVAIATLNNRFLQRLVIFDQLLRNRFYTLSNEILLGTLQNLFLPSPKQHNEEHDPDRCDECQNIREMASLVKRLEFIEPLMQTAICAELDGKQLAKLEEIAPVDRRIRLCKGWKIVAIPDANPRIDIDE